MAKLLMKSLSADLPALAELIRSQGRGRDTVLAHITPQEAALLKKRGGSGSMNPSTGLPEYQEDYGSNFYNPEDVSQFNYNPVEFDVPIMDQSAQDVFPDFYPSSPTGEISSRVQVGRSTPESLALETAEQYPDLYPGGRLPPDGYGTVYTTRGDAAYAPLENLQAYSQVPTLPPETPSKSVLDRLGITEKDAARLGLGTLLTGGLTAQNLSRTRQAQQQAEASREELARLGRPYQETGAQLRGAAERGELTPVNRQILNAARAQLQQGVATRGGVGTAQAQNQIADLTQRLIQNQFDLGLRISNIGDQYIQGAIRTGLQADQAINTANQQFYSQLAQMAAPFILGQAPVYQVTTPVGRA